MFAFGTGSNDSGYRGGWIGEHHENPRYVTYEDLCRAAGMPIDPTKVSPMASPCLDDEICDAEIMED